MTDRPVAFFDFDGTLTTGDTLLPFLKLVVGPSAYYRKLALISPVLSAYAIKLLPNNTAKEMVLKHYLAGYTLDRLEDYGRMFGERMLPAMLHPVGVERLKWHKSQGHDCVIVSASLNVYLDLWAKEQGFVDSLTSQLYRDEMGKITGRLASGNCYGEEKCKRIQRWLGGRQPSTTYAYGNTAGDLPMLRLVDEGWMMCNRGFRRIDR